MTDKNHASAFVLALLLAATAPAQNGRASRPASSPATAPAAGVLDRVVVIGASVSDSVVNGLSIARTLDLAIRTPHRRVAQVTSGAFYGGPARVGEVQIDRALRQEPTLLVGVDFLFWYAYGYLDGVFVRAGPGQPARRVPAAQEAAIRGRLLEQGLRELGRFGGHLVVGDLPDMSDADPIMLNPMQVPTREVRERLNERIHTWAKKRGRVLVLPLSQWVTDMKAGRMDLEAGGDATSAGGGSPAPLPPLVLTAEQVLQRDRLHPTGIGIVAMCTRICTDLRLWLGESADVGLDARAILDERGLLDRITEPVPGGK